MKTENQGDFGRLSGIPEYHGSALFLENDGKECYLPAAVGSKNEAGRKLVQSLAEEEDIHRHKLETVYHAISANKSWLAVGFSLGRGARISSAFAKTCQAEGVNIHAPIAFICRVQLRSPWA